MSLVQGVFNIVDEDIVGNTVTPEGIAVRDTSVIYELQRMFAFLQESTLGFYDPIRLIRLIKCGAETAVPRRVATL